MTNWGLVPVGTVLPFLFDTFAGATGASITMSGFAVTDIEVYKGTSMTQRASDNGYVLLDTDGTDLDGVTGIQGFSIDTGDNSDASFYAAGSLYTVIVAGVTVDSQTVNFVAGTFRLGVAEATAGAPTVGLTSASVQAIWDAATSALTTVGSIGKRIVDYLDAAVSTRSTYAGGDTAGTATLLTRIGAAITITGGKVDVNDKTGFSLSSAGIQAIWDAATSALTTVGSIGKYLVDRIDVVLSSRLAASSYTAPLDAAGTRGAMGLASANLDTQLAALASLLSAIKTTTDQLPDGGALTSLASDADIAALNDISVADIIAGISDGTFDFQEMTRIIFAACAGLSSEHELGTPKYRDAANTKNRISATTDANGNRTALTLDGS